MPAPTNAPRTKSIVLVAFFLIALVYPRSAEASRPRPRALGSADAVLFGANAQALGPQSRSERDIGLLLTHFEPDNTSPFELFNGGELARAALALDLGAREERLGLEMEPGDLGIEPLRGPPELDGETHRGEWPSYPKTRIGGIGLLLGTGGGAEEKLSLGLHWVCGASSCGLVEGKPQDPLGLMNDLVADQKMDRQDQKRIEAEKWCRAHPEQCESGAARTGGLLRIVGGGAQALAALGPCAVPEPLTKAACAFLIARSTDNITTGAIEVATGVSQETFGEMSIRRGLAGAGVDEGVSAALAPPLAAILLDVAPTVAASAASGPRGAQAPRPIPAASPQATSFSEVQAARTLEALQKENGAHFFSRHGAHTTIDAQAERAISGLTPDGFQGPIVDSTRFLNHVDQLETIQRATAIHRATGKNLVDLDMGRFIGEGIPKTTTDLVRTTNARVVFKDGKPWTAFPLIKPIGP